MSDVTVANEDLALAHRIVDLLAEKQAVDILLLDVDKLTSLGRYFLICTSESDRQTKALRDTVAESLKKEGMQPYLREGEPGDGWLILDYGSVIVHIFSPSQRMYYRLEDFWSAGRVVLRVQ